MLHNMRLDEWQRRAGLIREDIHRHVKSRLIRKQHLQSRILVAEEWLAFFAGFAHQRCRRGDARESSIGLLKDQNPSAGSTAPDTNIFSRGQINEAAGVEPMPAVI